MLLVEMTGESMSKELQMEVPDEYVVLAKHQVMGFDDQSICEILSCELIDLETAKADPIFKAVKALVVSANAQSAMKQSQGWDALETLAVEKLVGRMKVERDPEFLLKIAAVANKATRKTQMDERTLDPMGKGVSRITLTSRLVQRISQHGQAEQLEERELSISNGSMGRASFDEVNELLEVKPSPVLPKALEVQTHIAEPKTDDLLDDLMGRIKR